MSLENVLEYFKLKTFFLVKNIYSEIDVKSGKFSKSNSGEMVLC